MLVLAVEWGKQECLFSQNLEVCALTSGSGRRC